MKDFIGSEVVQEFSGCSVYEMGGCENRLVLKRDR